MQHAAGGNQAALAQLYDATSHLVFGLALRILGDRDAAEDVLIEVYAQAWREAKTYDPGRGTPGSWLLTMTRSRAIDLLRARKRDQATDPLESADDVESATPNPEDCRAEPGSTHTGVVTRGGCVFIAVSPQQDQLLA